MRFTHSLYRGFMVKYFQSAWRAGATEAHSPEEYFGFNPIDIEAIHFHRQGVGEGAWFRLNDGRVFDRFAQPSETNPAYYDATTH
jgi:hypothetical protein